MNHGERIKSLRLAKGLNTAQLAVLAGTNQPQISRIENGQRPRPELESRIAVALGVTVADLYSADRPWHVPVSRSVPMLEYQQIGRADAVAADNICTDMDVSAQAFAIAAFSEAMMPEFRIGDGLIVDPKVEPQPGDAVIAFNGTNPVFRQYRLRGQDPEGKDVFELHPLNLAFPSARSDSAQLRIIGTVVEHKRYLGRRS